MYLMHLGWSSRGIAGVGLHRQTAQVHFTHVPRSSEGGFAGISLL